MNRALLILFFIWFSLTVKAQHNFVDAGVQMADISNRMGNYGVAVGDYNNDGWEDLYVSCTGDEKNRLLENNGLGKFIDVSYRLPGSTEHTSASLWWDYNNDGWLDLFSANVAGEPNRLYRNDANGFFTEVSEAAGILHIRRHPESVNAADFNQDGLLDLYINTFNEDNLLYINGGDGTFVNRAIAFGANDKGHAMGTILFDYDNDQDVDIYMVFDGQPFRMLENNGQGHFTDVSERTQSNYTGYGMGVDVADINHDGFFDIYVTNLYENTLLLGTANNDFIDVSKSAGIQDLGMGWGVNFLDFDNDGFEDLYVVNQFGYSPEPNVLYHNNGDLTFTDVTTDLLKSEHNGFGSAVVDYNLDGKQDLLVANTNFHLQVIENQCESGNWLKLKLVDPTYNRFAIGARVKIHVGEQAQMDQITAGNGYISQSSSTVHFGMGQATSVERMDVTWPDGVVETFSNLAVNQYWLLERGKDLAVFDHAKYATIFPKKVVLAESKPIDTKFYPNPTSDELMVAKVPHQQWTLWDLSGNELSVPSRQEGSTWIRMDLSLLPAGIYLLKVEGAGASEIHRITKRP